MATNVTAWSMFINKHKDKDSGGRKVESPEWEKAMSLEDMDSVKYTTATATSTAAMMQQQLEELKQQQQAYQQHQQAAQLQNTFPAQLANAYGTASIPSVWTTGTTTTGGIWNGNTVVQYPGTPTPTETNEIKQLALLQVINLIANFGPTVSKRIVKRFNISITAEEIDHIHKDLTKFIAGDDDQDLEKVINEAVKEVKV